MQLAIDRFGRLDVLCNIAGILLMQQGLRANAVCPGSITAPMTSRNKLPENPDMKLILHAAALDKARGPETVAGVIAMLASEDGAHINGEHIRIDDVTLS